MLLSIGDQIRPGTYRLHSRFSRAVNFERRGRLVAVVDETIGPGPLNIVLRRRSADFQTAVSRICNPQGPETARSASRLRTCDAAECKSALRVGSGSVLFEGRCYHFTSRQRYHSNLSLSALNPRRFERNLSTLGEALRDASPSKSLAFLLDSRRLSHFQGTFDRTFAAQITRGVDDVFHGCLLAGIRRLRGCGLGLTPAGDDFIAGLLIGLHLLQKLHGWDYQPTANAVFRAARGDNIFSNTFLDLARRGLLFGRMKDLLQALVSGSAREVRKTAQKLFTIGETSGADLATGFFMAIHAAPRGFDAKER